MKKQRFVTLAELLGAKLQPTITLSKNTPPAAEAAERERLAREEFAQIRDACVIMTSRKPRLNGDTGKD